MKGSGEGRKERKGCIFVDDECRDYPRRKIRKYTSKDLVLRMDVYCRGSWEM